MNNVIEFPFINTSWGRILKDKMRLELQKEGINLSDKELNRVVNLYSKPLSR